MEVLNCIPYQAMCRYAYGLGLGQIADQLRAGPAAPVDWGIQNMQPIRQKEVLEQMQCLLEKSD